MNNYLTTDEIKEFQNLCYIYLKKNLTLEEAEDQGQRAVMLMEELVRFEPISMSQKDTVDLIRK